MPTQTTTDQIVETTPTLERRVADLEAHQKELVRALEDTREQVRDLQHALRAVGAVFRGLDHLAWATLSTR